MRVFWLVLICFLGVEANNDAAWNYYLSKDYSRSKASFEALTKKDPNNFSYQYNLASAFYRINQPIQAKIHYLKALKLRPSDADTRFNLNLINKKMIDQQFLHESYWLHVLGVNLNAWLVIVLVVSAIVLLGLIYFNRFFLTHAFKRSIAISLFIWGIFVGACVYAKSTESEYGIVNIAKAQIYSGPSKTQTALFFAHEGAECKVIKISEHWIHAQFPNGLKGWIQREVVTTI